MARISGVTIPDSKQIGISLTYVFGVGPKTSGDILLAAKVESTTRAKDLTDSEIAAIQNVINDNYTVEGELQRIVATNIKRLKDINSYRGIRHKNNLPTKGQRTRTNARTKRGQKRAIGGSQPKSASKT